MKGNDMITGLLIGILIGIAASSLFWVITIKEISGKARDDKERIMNNNERATDLLERKCYAIENLCEIVRSK